MSGAVELGVAPASRGSVRASRRNRWRAESRWIRRCASCLVGRAGWSGGTPSSPVWRRCRRERRSNIKATSMKRSPGEWRFRPGQIGWQGMSRIGTGNLDCAAGRGAADWTSRRGTVFHMDCGVRRGASLTLPPERRSLNRQVFKVTQQRAGPEIGAPHGQPRPWDSVKMHPVRRRDSRLS